MLRFSLLTALLSSCLPASAALMNGDFETGDFTGWTVFSDSNGVLFGGSSPDAPRITAFDVSGLGSTSPAAHFRVGRSGLPAGDAGGGIFQNINVPTAGDVTILADIAMESSSNNAAGGLFELSFNGTVVDSHDFGGVSPGIERSSLSATVSGVTPGTHEVRLYMARRFGATGSTPSQFLDNLTVVVPSAVPEPGGGVLLLACVAGIILHRRRPIGVSHASSNR